MLAAKISKYQKLLGRLKEKRANEEYDDETLKLTEALLTVNGECYTMWNFRRLTLIKKFEQIPDKFTADQKKEIKTHQIFAEKKLLEKELTFTQQAITKSPKSYWCWNQREWATTRLNDLSSCSWREELNLCNKLLHYDARNCE